MPDLSLHGRRVVYLDERDGVPVMFLHAGAGSGRQWSKTIAAFKRPLRAIAPDLWGFGNTDRWQGQQALSHDDQADLVERVIRHLDVAPVHLVGHSYGGSTALRLVARYPQLIQSLVLIEPNTATLLKLAGDTTLFDEYHSIAQSFLRHAAKGEVDDAWRMFIDCRNGPGTWARLSDTAKGRFRATTDTTVEGWHSSLSNRTTLDDLKRIAQRTLVLCGEKTSAPERRVTEILRDRIPGACYRIIPGAEHMSPLTHPAFIAEAIEQHLANGR